MEAEKLMGYAQHRLDEACRQDEDAATIQYWVGYLDALRAVEKEIVALQSLQQTCNNVATGDPLTLEQLREMDGKPVWVKVLDTRFKEENQWAICNAEYQMVTLKDGFKLFFCGYELNWLAYAYNPAHIDWKEWEPCQRCISKCMTCAVNETRKCTSCKSGSNYLPLYNFCPKCGRPLEDEAWDELEKRFRG